MLAPKNRDEDIGFLSVSVSSDAREEPRDDNDVDDKDIGSVEDDIAYLPSEP